MRKRREVVRSTEAARQAGRRGLAVRLSLVATTLGLPVGTVKSRLSRGRDGLRRGLISTGEERP